MTAIRQKIPNATFPFCNSLSTISIYDLGLSLGTNLAGLFGVSTFGSPSLSISIGMLSVTSGLSLGINPTGFGVSTISLLVTSGFSFGVNAAGLFSVAICSGLALGINFVWIFSVFGVGLWAASETTSTGFLGTNFGLESLFEVELTISSAAIAADFLGTNLGVISASALFFAISTGFLGRNLGFSVGAIFSACISEAPNGFFGTNFGLISSDLFSSDSELSDADIIGFFGLKIGFGLSEGDFSKLGSAASDGTGFFGAKIGFFTDSISVFTSSTTAGGLGWNAPGILGLKTESVSVLGVASVLANLAASFSATNCS
jgi:hypothetical protein